MARSDELYEERKMRRTRRLGQIALVLLLINLWARAFVAAWQSWGG
jgi:hypothetical protein